jgi:hypothetical protein
VTQPPSGMPPPEQAILAGADEPIELVSLAQEICRRYREEFPDEQERYGDAGMAWCVHDNQHILNWAVGARNGYVDFGRELAWLARVLEAREFPLERLARNLEIAAEVTGDLPVAGDLVAGARFIRSRESFLED